MARNNDTGLFQLENGNWAYRIFMNRKGMKKIDTTCRQDENGNPFKTKKAARDARTSKLAELKKDKPIEEEKPKIKDVKLVEIYNKYMKDGAIGKAPSTVKKQKSMWENHINKNFGERFISEITKDDLKNYLQKLYVYGDDVDGFNGGYAYKYVESFLKFFYLLFGVAYDSDLIDTASYTKMFLDRGSRLSMPKKTQETEEDEEENAKAYTMEEIIKIEEIFKRGNCYTAFLIAYHCGTRLSETFALTYDDISWADLTITVNKQMLYQDGCFCLCPVKTLQSRRVIDMPDELAKHLNDLYYNLHIIQDATKSPAYRNTEVVLDKTKSGKVEKIIGGRFINRKENGELLTPNSIKYWSKIIKQEADIDFKFHGLRKTHATMLAALNTPITELMDRLGHKKYDTTLSYYINKNMLAKELLKNNLNSISTLKSQQAERLNSIPNEVKEFAKSRGFDYELAQKLLNLGTKLTE